MIRYSISSSDILATVATRKPEWEAKARERTQVFVQAGGYVKQSDFWGDVKSVFIDLQYGKCIYCETFGEDGENSSIQWDLEHFRPKSNVRAWRSRSFTFPLGDPLPSGYYLLAYHLGNYAASCKTCNSPFKSDYFPIEGDRVIGGATPDAHTSEKAFLVYPIGEKAENPEEFITFRGAQAEPVNGSRRGEVMIDFLGLNRDGLQAARARWLMMTV